MHEGITSPVAKKKKNISWQPHISIGLQQHHKSTFTGLKIILSSVTAELSIFERKEFVGNEEKVSEGLSLGKAMSGHFPCCVVAVLRHRQEEENFSTTKKSYLAEYSVVFLLYQFSLCLSYFWLVRTSRLAFLKRAITLGGSYPDSSGSRRLKKKQEE